MLETDIVSDWLVELWHHIFVRNRSYSWLVHESMSSWPGDSEFLSIFSNDESCLNFCALVITTLWFKKKLKKNVKVLFFFFQDEKLETIYTSPHEFNMWHNDKFNVGASCVYIWVIPEIVQSLSLSGPQSHQGMT